jgi:flagellar hook-length control protein FliK
MSDQNNGFNQQAASAQNGNGGGQRGARAGGAGQSGNDAGDGGAQRASAPARRLPAGAVDTFA